MKHINLLLLLLTNSLTHFILTYKKASFIRTIEMWVLNNIREWPLLVSSTIIVPCSALKKLSNKLITIYLHT